jgi:hypothetical protein
MQVISDAAGNLEPSDVFSFSFISFTSEDIKQTKGSKK